MTKSKWDSGKRYRALHTVQVSEKERRGRQKLKREVFEHYSPSLRCVRCGFSDIRALSIDHIDGSGAAQRKALGAAVQGSGLYRYLRQNNYPPGYQVLCMNCQRIKQFENREWGNTPYGVMLIGKHAHYLDEERA